MHFHSSRSVATDNIDLNPVDYKILGNIQQQVHQSQLHSIDELKNRFLDVWHRMDQSVIEDAVHDCSLT